MQVMRDSRTSRENSFDVMSHRVYFSRPLRSFQDATTRLPFRQHPRTTYTRIQTRHRSNKHLTYLVRH